MRVTIKHESEEIELMRNLVGKLVYERWVVTEVFSEGGSKPFKFEITLNDGVLIPKVYADIDIEVVIPDAKKKIYEAVHKYFKMDLPQPAAGGWEPIEGIKPESGCSYIVANKHDYNIIYYSGYGGVTFIINPKETFTLDEIKKRFTKFTRVSLPANEGDEE